MPLLLGETLVGGDEHGEALCAGLGQFGVTQRAPPVVHGAFDGGCHRGPPVEEKADPRRDPDVEQDLQVPRSSGEVGAGGVCVAALTAALPILRTAAAARGSISKSRTNSSRVTPSASQSNNC